MTSGGVCGAVWPFIMAFIPRSTEQSVSQIRQLCTNNIEIGVYECV